MPIDPIHKDSMLQDIKDADSVKEQSSYIQILIDFLFACRKLLRQCGQTEKEMRSDANKQCEKSGMRVSKDHKNNEKKFKRLPVL